MMKNYFGTFRLFLLSLSALAVFAAMPVSNVMAQSQQTVSGKSSSISGVVKSTTGEPIVGVTVVVEGTSTGVVTSTGGAYKINAPAGANLVFSYVGYKTVTKKVANATAIDVQMQEDQSVLDEVVVVGYGTQKKATLSGSVASVKGSEIVKSPAMNVTNSMAGNIAGLVVVGQSGEPGSDFSDLYIRGKGSLNDNSPLIVVDGVPNRSLERIDPSTIETVTVLKDASAAIYGSQAANGVILVTTKRGKVDKLTISANYNAGWSRPTRIQELCNAAEYATLVNEIKYYRDEDPVYLPEDIRKFADGSDLWGHPNTDWYDAVLKPWSLQQNANISMSGGTEKLQAFVSFSTRNQDGYFRNNSSKYAQHDLKINIDSKINEYISLATDASLRLEQKNSIESSASRLFQDLTTTIPTIPALWPNGLPGAPADGNQISGNPYVSSTPATGYNDNEKYVINLNAKLNIKIPWVEGLSFTGTVAFDRALQTTKKFNKQVSLYAWDKVSYDENHQPALTEKKYGMDPSLIQKSETWKNYLINGLLNYQRTFGIHDVSVLVGVEAIESTSLWFQGENRKFTSSFPDELNFGDPTKQYSNGSNPGKDRWLNYFGRVNYSLMSRYIVEFVWRYQGSSKFASQSRWGFFPGVSAAYRISEEGFWAKSGLSKVANNFKFRASWGRTGNDRIDPYQFLSLYDNLGWPNFVGSDGNNMIALVESLAGNNAAQWEVADQYNVGIDVGFFDNRLNLTADYFNNLRTKILIPQKSSVPDFTGITSILPDVNMGEVRNRGFDFQLSWADKAGDFTYRVSLNGGHAKNKILFFDEAAGAPAWQSNTGHPMNTALYYKAMGIYKTQADLDKYPHFDNARLGDIIFENFDGNDVLDGKDMVRIHKSDVPTWTGGLNLFFGYKGIELSMLFQGQAGAVRYVQGLGSYESAQINFLKSFYDNRWTEDNPNANSPRTFNRNDEYWVSSENRNTFWLKKTDFIRLKNLELAYNLPAKWINRVGLDNLRVNLTGMNLFTYSPDMKDYDPELVYQEGFAGSGYPLQKMIMIGVSIQF